MVSLAAESAAELLLMPRRPRAQTKSVSFGVFPPPSQSLNPSTAYDTLVEYGAPTLRYVNIEEMKGNQTG